jgi:hypothetical protein
MGINVLEPDLSHPDAQPNLMLSHQTVTETIIIGLPPSEHGLTLDNVVAWEIPVLAVGSRVVDALLSDEPQTWLGA